MSTAHAMAGETTVTQRLLAAAAARDGHVALTGGPADLPGSGSGLSYPDLAAAVQRAAAGLAWRGVRPRDVVGVYVADALSYILACHAVRAAGAVPSPVSAGLSVPEAAGQLADCGARMLITSSGLAAAGLAAADRSWVRQVISFGEAAGAMPFSSLLGLGTMPPAPVRPHDAALLPYLRRPDGTMGPAAISHLDMTAELARLGEEAGISECDVVLAAPPAGDGRAYTALVDNALLRGAAVVAAGPAPAQRAAGDGPGPAEAAAPGCGLPAADLAAAARRHHATAAIVPSGVEIPATPALKMLSIDC